MKIRDAEPKDAAQLDALLTKLIRDETQYDSNLNGECTVTDNYCTRIGLEGHKLLLVEENGEIAGYLYGFVYQIPNITLHPTAVLDALFVDEKYREKGFASALITEFQKFAAENRACRIELKVVSDNKAALALYRKHNFTEAKKYMNKNLSE